MPALIARVDQLQRIRRGDWKLCLRAQLVGDRALPRERVAVSWKAVWIVFS